MEVTEVIDNSPMLVKHAIIGLNSPLGPLIWNLSRNKKNVVINISVSKFKALIS